MTSHSPIKVMHIASGDLWAGAEVQLYTLVKALKRNTITDVHVILMNHGMLEQKLLSENIPVTVFDESKLGAINISVKIFQTLRKIRPNVVHTHRGKENVLGSVACLLAGNIPSIRTTHGAAEHKTNWRYPAKSLAVTLDWLSGWILQRKIVAVSEDLATILSRKFPKRKVAVIENGIDIKELDIYKRFDNSTQRKNLYKIGLIGRLVPVKRIDLFIEVAEYMRDHHPDISAQFHIYGDGPLREELINLSYDRAVDNIVYFEGHYPNIYPALASLDALIITSDHEGLPMTLLEAMAFRTPIVARSVGGITAACGDGKYCWLVKDDSAKCIAQMLIECLSNHNDRQHKCALAEKHVCQKYSSTSNATLVNNIYNKLAKTQTYPYDTPSQP